MKMLVEIDLDNVAFSTGLVAFANGDAISRVLLKLAHACDDDELAIGWRRPLLDNEGTNIGFAEVVK